jgi:hypothetical protein
MLGVVQPDADDAFGRPRQGGEQRHAVERARRARGAIGQQRARLGQRRLARRDEGQHGVGQRAVRQRGEVHHAGLDHGAEARGARMQASGHKRAELHFAISPAGASVCATSWWPPFSVQASSW